MAQVASDPGSSAGSVGLDIDGAAAQLESLLGTEDSDEEKPDAPTEAEPEAVDPAEGEAETATEDDPEVADSQPKYTVKVDGKELAVPVSELIQGYQKGADYTQKTQRLAAERREHEVELEAVKTERSKYAQLLTQLDARLKETLPSEPDWNKLQAEDPVGFASQWAQRQRIQQERAVIQMEQNKLQQQTTVDQQAQLQTHIADEVKKLAGAIPEWSDPAKAKAEKQALMEYGLTQDFSESELADVSDHRAVRLLRKAWLYDQLVARRQAAQAKIGGAKVLAPGSGNTPRKVTDMTRAKQRLAQTGSVQDAAAIFERTL